MAKKSWPGPHLWERKPTDEEYEEMRTYFREFVRHLPEGEILSEIINMPHLTSEQAHSATCEATRLFVKFKKELQEYSKEVQRLVFLHFADHPLNPAVEIWLRKYSEELIGHERTKHKLERSDCQLIALVEDMKEEKNQSYAQIAIALNKREQYKKFRERHGRDFTGEGLRKMVSRARRRNRKNTDT